jgi:hypothetical protein
MATLPIPQRLHAAIQAVIRETRGFNERKQEAWCRICRYKDPLGTKLHDSDCPIYELHAAWEEAIVSPKREHEWQFYTNGTFCKRCGAVIGSQTECR